MGEEEIGSGVVGGNSFSYWGVPARVILSQFLFETSTEFVFARLFRNEALDPDSRENVSLLKSAAGTSDGKNKFSMCAFLLSGHRGIDLTAQVAMHS